MKSLEFLNDQFSYIKEKGKVLDIGSITPRTASKKFALDQVAISKEAQENMTSFAINL